MDAQNNIKTAGVIGLGYVGLPLLVTIARRGLNGIGFDVSAERTAQINRGESYIGDIPNSELAPHVEAGKIRATTDFSELAKCDLISICVPTPLRKTRDPDISYILESVERIAENLRQEQTIVLESTTYPGTTREILLPRLEKSGLKAGKDFFLAFSPERVDPGRADHTTANIPKVIGGVTEECTKRANAAYQLIFENTVPVSRAMTAEMVKILENTFRQVNIGLINEVAQICHHLGISVWEVINAAATKPFGFMPFYPGPGLGGHCIPVDPHYLAWKMRSLNYTTKFIELASAVNTEMPRYVVERVAEALNNDVKPLKNSKVLLMGVAYKKDVSDCRESPAVDIANILRRAQADVSFHDPHVDRLHLEHHVDADDVYIENSELSPELLSSADIVVILTDHSAFDPAYIVQHSKLVYDTRNLCTKIPRESIPESCRVLSLGDGSLY
jgi:UDP-N-acetyl-D-glucosamine dehydrogenase